MHVEKYLRNIKDPKRLVASTLRFLDEYYGDSMPTTSICHLFDSLIAVKNHDLNIAAQKEGPISIDRITRHLDLKENDPYFVEFQDHVDTITLR